MIKLNSLKNKKSIFIYTLLFILTLNVFLLISSFNQDFKVINQYLENEASNLIRNLRSQDLASDNTFTGIGDPWNVTHWANRTDSDLEVSFT
ncbi:MAG: hypothetical protein ACFFE4_10515, partial [Candidatus Thorarchaeota archaeon]